MTRFLLLMLLMAPALAGGQTDSQRVAVLELGNPAELSRQEVAYLTDFVRKMARDQLPTGRFVIMTRENITALLGDRALADCQGDCAVQTGRNLDAAYVVAGEVRRYGTELRLSLTLHETTTANLLRSVMVAAADVTTLEAPLAAKGRELFLSLRPRGAAVEDRLGDDTLAWAPAGETRVVVRFESEPVGAMVEINGEPVGETPCSRPLPTGQVEVGFKLLKYIQWSDVVEVQDGMPPIHARLEPNFGWVTVRTEPDGLMVDLDGEPLGTSPITRHEIELGVHEIWVREPYFTPQGAQIVIERGEHEELAIALVPINGGLKLQSMDPDGNAVNADVLVDGLLVGRTWATLTVQAGPHQVEVRNDAGLWSGTITVPAESVLAQDVALGAAAPGANSLGMTMMRIEPGSFLMGSPPGETDRDPQEDQHEVTLTRPFSMSATEVTQRQWETVMGNNPSRFKTSSDLPVENVTWYDCVDFCNKLSLREGLTPAYTMTGEDVTCDPAAPGYRLPTEEEWEYACRAGTATQFNIGDDDADLDQAAWYAANSGATTHTVAGKAGNDWGLYDMHGNVWEWCNDQYDTAAYRALRGGYWGNLARYCRSACRNGRFPTYASDRLGFRPVKSCE